VVLARRRRANDGVLRGEEIVEDQNTGERLGDSPRTFADEHEASRRSPGRLEQRA
jgi:hypothetical protein